DRSARRRGRRPGAARPRPARAAPCPVRRSRDCRSPLPSATSARFDRLRAEGVDFFLVLFAVGLGQFVDLFLADRFGLRRRRLFLARFVLADFFVLLVLRRGRLGRGGRGFAARVGRRAGARAARGGAGGQAAEAFDLHGLVGGRLALADPV